MECRAIRYVAHGPVATPAQVALSEELVINTRRDARTGAGASLSRLDIMRWMARLTVPTVVVAGERDRVTPPSLARRFAEELPDLVELGEIPGSGHMTPLEQPDEVTSRVRALEARAGVTASAAA
jgi:pimeloyl-ACP methyl ester carboxylesterase